MEIPVSEDFFSALGASSSSAALEVLTDFVSLSLRTGRATNEETGESHEVTYLNPDSFVLNDIYYKNENVDVNGSSLKKDLMKFVLSMNE